MHGIHHAMDITSKYFDANERSIIVHIFIFIALIGFGYLECVGDRIVLAHSYQT